MNETQQILQKISDLEDKISELTSEVEYLKMFINVEPYLKNPLDKKSPFYNYSDSTTNFKIKK